MKGDAQENLDDEFYMTFVILNVLAIL